MSNRLKNSFTSLVPVKTLSFKALSPPKSGTMAATAGTPIFTGESGGDGAKDVKSLRDSLLLSLAGLFFTVDGDFFAVALLLYHKPPWLICCLSPFMQVVGNNKYSVMQSSG